MEIDVDRRYTLTKFSSKNGEIDRKESDHNLMILNIKSNWVTLVADGNKREEIYNYRNVEDFNTFKNETEQNKELGNFFN